MKCDGIGCAITVGVGWIKGETGLVKIDRKGDAGNVVAVIEKRNRHRDAAIDKGRLVRRNGQAWSSRSAHGQGAPCVLPAIVPDHKEISYKQ